MTAAQSSMIPTAYGEGRLELHAASSPVATVLLSHGAGNGIETHDLQALASALPGEGVSVALFEQPWRTAGRTVASAPATLDVGLTAAAGALGASTPLIVGGRSAGARSAARTATALGAVGCLALAFPLHPPGKPERSRLAELTGAGVPTLVIQGERDPMGRPEEFPGGPTGTGLAAIDLVIVPAADHALRVAKTGPIDQDEANAILVESTLEWLIREIIGE